MVVFNDDRLFFGRLAREPLVLSLDAGQFPGALGHLLGVLLPSVGLVPSHWSHTPSVVGGSS